MHNTCCISQSTTASLAAASNSSLLPSFSSTPGSICRPSSSFSISVSSELTVLAFSFSTIFSIFHTLSVTMHKTRFCFNLVFIFEYIFHQVWNSLCDEHWYCQCVCDSIITVINVFYICGKIINSLTSAPIHFEKQTTSLQKSFFFFIRNLFTFSFSFSYRLFSSQIYMVLFFAHISFVVNRTFNATPTDWEVAIQIICKEDLDITLLMSASYGALFSMTVIFNFDEISCPCALIFLPNLDFLSVVKIFVNARSCRLGCWK